MNTPTSKEVANLQKLIEMTPIASGFDFLTKENVARTLVYFGDKFKVVGARSKRSILIQRLDNKHLYSISANNWLNAAMREQLTFE